MLVWRAVCVSPVMMSALPTSASFDPTCCWSGSTPPALQPGDRLARAAAEADAKEDAEVHVPDSDTEAEERAERAVDADADADADAEV
jgi:hypothetical protein